MSENISQWIPVGEDSDGVERMKVRGGQLYRTLVTSGGEQLLVTSVAMVFVPDPEPRRRVVIKRR